VGHWTVNRDTSLFFSVSEKPGNFGSVLYNKAFQELDIDAIYKPLKLRRDYDFLKFIEVMSEIGVSGISVSMPFKKEAYKYCFRSGPEVSKIQNANTMLFESEVHRPLCYNTDYIGFEESCKHLLEKSKTVYVYGHGAVSDSITYVLMKYHVEFMRGRRQADPSKVSADLLINASPVGMSHVPDKIFTEDTVKRYKYVFDVVVSKETNLIKTARSLNKECVTGPQMSLEQLCKQFEIYTGLKAPRQLFVDELEKNDFL